MIDATKMKDGRGRLLRTAGADNFAIVNAALHAAATASGQAVSLGSGAIPALPGGIGQIVWPVGAAGIRLVGEGKRATTLMSAPGVGVDMIAATGTNECGMTGLGLVALGSSRFGSSLLRLTDAWGWRADDLFFAGDFDQAVAIVGPNTWDVRFDDFDSPGQAGGAARGIVFVLGDGSGVVEDVYLSNGNAGGNSNPNSVGALLVNASGVYMSDIDWIAYGVGVATRPGPGQVVIGLAANDVLCDTCLSAGWQIGTNGGDADTAVRSTRLSNCWGSSSGDGASGPGDGPGILIVGGATPGASCRTTGITISNTQMPNNSQSGLAVRNGANVTMLGVNGCMASDSSQQHPGQYAEMDLGDCASGIVSNCLAGHLEGFGDSSPASGGYAGGAAMVWGVNVGTRV